MKRGGWLGCLSLSVALALGLGCSPSYQSGQTLCSEKGDCPEGWVCAGGFCHDNPASAADAAQDGRVGVDAGRDAPVTNMDAPVTMMMDAPGTTPDTMVVTRDTAIMPADTGLPSTCQPTTPVSCPATTDRVAVCLPAGGVCSTVVTCDSQYYACTSADLVADCQNACTPVTTCNAQAAAGMPCQMCIIQKCCSLAVKCTADPNCETTSSGPVWDEFLGCATRYCGTICQNMPP